MAGKSGRRRLRLRHSNFFHGNNPRKSILFLVIGLLIVHQGTHRKWEPPPSSSFQRERLVHFKTQNNIANNVWEEKSAVLPNWMREYFGWHKRQRQKLVQEWKPLFTSGKLNATEASMYLSHQSEYRFLVIRCLSFDRKCGGLADRLLPLPYLLQVAHTSSRILLIYFQRPAPLEEYLVPPRGGIDWRLPDWLEPAMPFGSDSRRFKAMGFLETHAHSSHANDTVVQSIFQSFHYGALPYDQRRMPDEPSFTMVLRDVWRVFFTPILPIQQIIRQQLRTLGLQEGHYAGVHVRALYAIQDYERDPRDTQLWTQNAIHCASQIYPGGPYYVASDSPVASQMAVDYGRQLLTSSLPIHRDTDGPLVASRNVSSLLHFGRIPANPVGKALDYVPADYYDTYIDLMILAMAQCVAYGKGGYGQLASYLSFNATCSKRHYKKKLNKCQWNDGFHDATTRRGRSNVALPSLLAPPMKQE